MNVLIADGNTSVRYGIIALLEELPQVNIVGEAASFKDMERLILMDCPDMILLSWELPGKGSEALIKSIRLMCPQATIVIMSSQLNAASRAQELGADGFISKAEPAEKLLQVIRYYSSKPYQLELSPSADE